jgi:STE24 endopeptidase
MSPYRARRWGRRVLGALGLLLMVVAWLLAARALWRSTVPGGLRLPHIDPTGYFTRAFLHSSASYERFLSIDGLLAKVALVLVLVLYARHGQRLMRESAAGPIGTGMLLGMLGLAIVWLVEVPFFLIAMWWERGHHVSHEGYVTGLISSFLGLGGSFLFICLALLVTMALARLLRSWWWTVAVPFWMALSLLLTFGSVYLIPDTHPLRNSAERADERTLARAEGVPGVGVEVQRVARETTAPNAESVGFGSTRRVILWDTLLDGRFSRSEIRVVIAHELGHLAHQHPLRRVGWLALFLLPAAMIVARLTRSRGGMARPEAIPVALLVFVVLQMLALPLQNLVSRHEEAEADWSALRTTRDPAAARALFTNLALTSHADPDPPSWSYALDADHPSIVQRIAMVEAWQEAQPRTLH